MYRVIFTCGMQDSSEYVRSIDCETKEDVVELLTDLEIKKRKIDHDHWFYEILDIRSVKDKNLKSTLTFDDKWVEDTVEELREGPMPGHLIVLTRPNLEWVDYKRVKRGED